MTTTTDHLRGIIRDAVQELLRAEGAESMSIPMGSQQIVAGNPASLARMLGYSAPGTVRIPLIREGAAAPASQAAEAELPKIRQLTDAEIDDACFGIYHSEFGSDAKGYDRAIARAVLALAGAAPVEAASPWIKNTGVQPVANDVRVAVIHVDGDFGCDPADHFDWDIEDDGSDVAAYFVIPAAPAPGEAQ
jgi:hypothetical protein